MKKILVSIANYCDPEFYSTMLSLWEQAKNKEDLYFSIVSEDNKEYDLSFIPSSQLFYRHFDLSEYRGGVCWACSWPLERVVLSQGGSFRCCDWARPPHGHVTSCQYTELLLAARL